MRRASFVAGFGNGPNGQSSNLTNSWNEHPAAGHTTLGNTAPEASIL